MRKFLFVQVDFTFENSARQVWDWLIRIISRNAKGAREDPLKQCAITECLTSYLIPEYPKREKNSKIILYLGPPKKIGDFMSKELPRDFKGIWIPKELWLDKRLNHFEKILLAEIDSLDCSNDHCYADNEYFENMFEVGVKTIQRGISKLKELGLISQVSFDGRDRVLKSNMKNIYDIFYRSDATQTDVRTFFTGLQRQKCPSEPIENAIDKENILENKEKDILRISKKRQKKEPEPTKERDPGIFTTDYEHQKLVERIGSEKEVKDLYFEISRWKKREGIEGGDDYKTVIKWIRPKQKKEILSKKDNPKIHDDPILTWKFVKQLEETDPLAAKYEINKMDEVEMERYGKWKIGKLY